MIPLIVADELRRTIVDYLETTFAFRDEATAEALRQFLLDPEHGIFRGPYLNVRLPFRRGEVHEAQELLDIAPAFRPFKHQIRAFARLTSKDGHQPQTTIVTTGTGSGKTECFLYPILDHCLRNNEKRGVKALILYPMNALAEDQAGRLAQMIYEDSALRGKISAGLYVGGNGRQKVMSETRIIDAKPIMRSHPPDILLTNYKMLDFMLTRAEDKAIWQSAMAGMLRYLVLDELHSYEGAQGSDVACLVRRLRARLNAGPNDICFVGTSATLAGGASGARELVEFTRKISGASVYEDAIVTEDRLHQGEFLDARPSREGFPSEVNLLPVDGEAADSFLDRQEEAWFARRFSSRVELGNALTGHAFLGTLLDAVSVKGRPLTPTEFDDALCARDREFGALPLERRNALVTSFLSLVSRAKRREGTREEPLLQTQVQLWMRALSNLRREAAHSPAFFWDEDTPGRRGFPSVYCRECGYSGWMTILPASGGPFETDIRRIREEFYASNRRVRYLFPDPEGTDKVYLNPFLMTLETSPSSGGRANIPIRDIDEVRKETETKKDRHWCPACETDGSLALVGSAGASIASVAIAHIYASPFNQDKKLLAFTDSVQDASHRAGFFTARTFRFNLRTAIQAVLEKNGPIPLDEIVRVFQRHWMEVFLDETRDAFAGMDIKSHERAAFDRFVATFLPPDLAGLREYTDLMEGGKDTKRILQATLARLSWEITLEYGLNLRVGRTLDKVRCSTAWFKPDLLQEALKKVDAIMTEYHPWWADVPSDRRRQFVVGFLMRMKRRGAVLDPLIDKYFEDPSTAHFLTKRGQRFMSPFSMETPRPKLVCFQSGPPAFDSLSGSSGLSWYRDWWNRCVKVDKSVATDVDAYRQLVVALAHTGLLEARETKRGTVWGIPMSALEITPDVVTLRSNDGDDLTLPSSEAEHWIGQSSLSYRGNGTYAQADGRRQSYYETIYRSGNVRRIHGHEHTGLLDRLERTSVERQFKDSSRADSPNLLTCTPTLEMGIDVGDLSTTMVCSIPPTTTNYVQRIGRAGRKTGNALILALATPTPHDLYFFAEPESMFAGEVLPPGCYLDAAEMLKRQFTAFCLDWWTATYDGLIPATVNLMLSGAARGGFPEAFLKRVDTSMESKFEEFASLFGTHLSPEGKARIRDWALDGGMRRAVAHALAAVEQELSDLRAADKRLKKRLDDLAKDLAQKHIDEARHRDEWTEVNAERKTLERRGKEVRRAYPLNFLVEHGVLPNYNLPEGGVKLRMTLVTQNDTDAGGAPKVVSKEYARAASSALREFAPGSTFYVGGRKLPITQADTGGKNNSRLETWRLCADCGHSRLTGEADGENQCPRCGSQTWKDVGQQKTMLLMTRVSSRVNDAESRTLDDADDRETHGFATKELFEIPSHGTISSHVNSEASFGFELLSQVTMRELNFGPAQFNAGQFTVAGDSVPSVGFRICRDCGVAYPGNGTPRHRSSCRLQEQPEAAAFVSTLLYRELQSEAIRFLLPVATHAIDQRLSTFRACLELGLRRKFGGKADHLRLSDMTMPGLHEDTGTRNYLVLYDSVPGGTGYLKEFGKSRDAMKEVFEHALATLESCSCQRKPQADGCYRCIFAYRRQRDMNQLSRRLGIELMGQVLNAWPGLEDGVGLGTVGASDSLIESELEGKFRVMLTEAASETKGTEVPGAEVIHCKFGERWWKVELQRPVGPADGVDVMSRPDCLLTCSDETLKPIALFLDGYRFHVRPGEPESRLVDDLRKRQAIRASGAFVPWTLTWFDLEEEKDYEGPFWSTNQKDRWPSIAKTDREALCKNAFQVFVDHLREGTDDQRSKMALNYVTSASGPLLGDAAGFSVVAEAILSGQKPITPTEGGPTPGVLNLGEGSRWVATLEAAGGAIAAKGAHWLSDNAEVRSAPSFLREWRLFWRTFNFVAPLETLKFGVGEVEGDQTPAPRYLGGDVEQLVKSLGDQNVPAPTLGYELVSASDEVVATAEAGWEEEQVAVLLADRGEDKTEFQSAGWAVFEPPYDFSKIRAALEK